MIMIPPIPSTIVATCFTTLVAALACVQFYRSRTPLRLGSAVMAVCGLSISALSIVYTADKMSLSIFWVYQFIAECIAVTWVISTIIQLGYAFYPLTRHQTLIWRTALASVIIYDLVAISELSYYCYAVWGSHSLNMESTPVVWIYWVRQMVKVLACAVTIAYLFVPLVRHHNSTGVVMIADSNTLAVGTWYLSALGATSLGYCAMFIYYMTKPNEVFSPQAQALDLCIRLIACPIFSLPPPRILLRHYKDKYGSGARDDNNLNTMIEDGITNDPRPRRPAMLIAQPSFPSARHSDFIFHPPHHRPTSFLATRPSEEFYATREMEEKHLSTKRFMEGGSHNAGGTTSSSEATVTETNNNSKVTSSGGDRGAGDDPTASLFITSDLPSTATTTTTKENKSYPVVGMDEAVLSNLSISSQSVDFQTTPSAKNNSNSAATTPVQHLSSPLTSSFFHLNNTSNISSKRDEDDETAVAARRISRRLTMEGRRDGLDFLNIAGLIKWPHRSGGGGQSSASSSSTHLPSTTSMVFTPTTTVPKSSLAIKSSQSFPPMALNRAEPSGPSSSISISISAGIENNHGMVVRGSGGIGGGGNRKERLSVISSMLEADGVLSHDDDDYDDDSHHSQRRESFHELYEKPSSSTMATATHNNNISYSSSTNSTIRPPSPSVDPSNSTPTPSHISTGQKAMGTDIGIDTSLDMVKIRRQSRDTLTRLHGDSLAASVVNIAMVQTGPHSPTILRTGLTPRAKQDSKILRRSSSSSSSSSAPSSPTSAESITTTLPSSSASP